MENYLNENTLLRYHKVKDYKYDSKLKQILPRLYIGS